MGYILVNDDNEVLDKLENGEPFPVAKSLRWVQIADVSTVRPHHDVYNSVINGVKSKPDTRDLKAVQEEKLKNLHELRLRKLAKVYGVSKEELNNSEAKAFRDVVIALTLKSGNQVQFPFTIQKTVQSTVEESLTTSDSIISSFLDRYARIEQINQQYDKTAALVIAATSPAEVDSIEWLFS